MNNYDEKTPGDDGFDQEAAQHADTLAMQKQVLDDLFVLWVDAPDTVENDRRAENIAAALGCSREFEKLIDATFDKATG